MRGVDGLELWSWTHPTITQLRQQCFSKVKKIISSYPAIVLNRIVAICVCVGTEGVLQLNH